MDKEVMFAKALEQVKAQALEQGRCISEEQVKEAFADLSLSEEQLQMVYDYLDKNRIGIGGPLDMDTFLTEDERSYLQDYMNEIASLPDYEKGQIEAYTIAAMAGETQAQARLIEIYLKDVIDIAKLYIGQGVSLEDLIGEGNLALSFGMGMLGSLDDPGEVHGMLAKLIMDFMEDTIRENASGEKTGRKAADKVNQVAEKAKELAGQLHRKVTPEELAEETGMSVKAIRDAMRISGYRIEDIENAENGL